MFITPYCPIRVNPLWVWFWRGGERDVFILLFSFWGRLRAELREYRAGLGYQSHAVEYTKYETRVPVLGIINLITNVHLDDASFLARQSQSGMDEWAHPYMPFISIQYEIIEKNELVSPIVEVRRCRPTLCLASKFTITDSSSVAKPESTWVKSSCYGVSAALA